MLTALNDPCDEDVTKHAKIPPGPALSDAPGLALRGLLSGLDGQPVTVTRLPRVRYGKASLAWVNGSSTQPRLCWKPYAPRAK
jgi:hypothetical protein